MGVLPEADADLRVSMGWDILEIGGEDGVFWLLVGYGEVVSFVAQRRVGKV